MPWGAIVTVACQLIDLFLTDKKRRDALKLQMYEFAKKHDRDVIDGNEKLRDEYARIREEMDDLGLTMFSESEIEDALGLNEPTPDKEKSGKKKEVTCPECSCTFQA